MASRLRPPGRGVSSALSINWEAKKKRPVLSEPGGKEICLHHKAGIYLSYQGRLTAQGKTPGSLTVEFLRALCFSRVLTSRNVTRCHGKLQKAG